MHYIKLETEQINFELKEIIKVLNRFEFKNVIYQTNIILIKLINHYSYYNSFEKLSTRLTLNSYDFIAL